MTGFHRRSPIAFAHRGGMSGRQENTLEAFRTAIEMGATGLETDTRRTKDGVVVLRHDARIFTRWLYARVARLAREQLPSRVPSLAEAIEVPGARNVAWSVDIKDGQAKPVIEVMRNAGLAQNLWLIRDVRRTRPDLGLLGEWRQLDPDVHLVDSTTVRHFDMAPDVYVRRIAVVGVEALNLPTNDWTPDLVARAHEAGLQCFAHSAHTRSLLDHALAMGVDAVYSDDVSSMLAAIAAAKPPSSEQVDFVERPDS